MNFEMVSTLIVFALIATSLAHGEPGFQPTLQEIADEILLLRNNVKVLETTVTQQNKHIADLQQTTRSQQQHIEGLLADRKTQEVKTQDQQEHIAELLADRKAQDIKHNKLVSRVRTLELSCIKKSHSKFAGDSYRIKHVKEIVAKDKTVSRKERLLAPSATNIPPYEGVIAFYAYMSADEVSPGAHHTLIFDTVKTNAGGGYNSITGIFTAPSDGVYVFIWVIRIDDAQHSTELLINTSVYGATFLRAKNGDDGSVSGTVVAHVKKDDVVFVRIHSTYAGDGNAHSNFYGRTSFSGWLLH